MCRDTSGHENGASGDVPPYLVQGTMLNPSTSHIGKGVALSAQAATPESPRVYRRSTISDSRMITLVSTQQ